MEYYDYISQLDKNRSIFVEFFGGISQEEASWRAQDDRWTVLEIVNHLIDIEKEDFRFEFKLILENPEINWPSFNIEEWRIERKYNERALFKSIEAFDVERKESIGWLKGIANPDLNSEHSGNGFDGQKMKAGDVMAAWIAHDFFHIRQLALAKWYILNESVKPFSSSYSGFYE